MKEKVIKSMDGNEAAAHCAYAFSEVAAIYPITPSSPMGEHVDAWAAKGQKNIFGMPVKVIEMQSEAGAAGTVHGSLQMGVLTTTFTASQGLLLKIPNMYKIAGQGLPGVIHVAARSLATQALSIFGDHQDVMATRQTGFAMLCSNSVQEVMDLGGIAHLSAIKSRIPFLHFFDGFRTSHEVNTVEVMDYDVFKRLVDYDKINEFRKLGLNPNKPVTRGTAQSDDVYFQARMAHEVMYKGLDDIVNTYMQEISKETGRKYAPFTYYGTKDATDIIIAMGSVVDTIKQVVDALNSKGRKVGVMSVHLFRPFSKKYFFKAFPKTVERIAVLDRTIESGSIDEPLCQDVKSLFYTEEKKPLILGGIYGLSSKDTTPAMLASVYDNLVKGQKDHFTIGIDDDVLKTSLKPVNKLSIDNKVSECLLFGLGSDGTVGASKNIVKIIGDKTKLYSQAYASYDSKKAGGVTRMHLRFSKTPITSTYLVSEPSFISCSNESYIFKYDLLKGLKNNGVFLLNTRVKLEDIEEYLPNRVKIHLAKKNAKLYIVDAADLAYKIGLGRRTNTIMQSAFFKLNEDLLEFSKAQEYMKAYALKSYGKKGEQIVNMNYQAIDAGGDEIISVPVKKEWAKLPLEDTNLRDENTPDFVAKISDVVNRIEGDTLPVSAFIKYPDAHMEQGASAYEKRGVANFVPRWNSETCIQCNQCVFACPHAVVRSFLVSEQEAKNLPEGTQVVAAKGKFSEPYQFSIQVSGLDCTECGVCVDVCPTKEKSLTMVPLDEELKSGRQKQAEYFFNNITYKDLGDDSVKNVNFRKPLFEFSGACAGCGETPYYKALTQLFGDRMVIANATGCTSIFTGSYPSTPLTTNILGYGPAWANSLFEDNAEFGFGMRIAHETIRDRIQTLIYNNLEALNDTQKAVLSGWVENRYDGPYTRAHYDEIITTLEGIDKDFAKEILDVKDYLIKTSQWIIGGDGWAYDIGYGGIDHVLANNEDVNILVVDTEVYSNTGGQSSKAAPTGAIAKFAASGKKTKKKDLASIAMSYGSVYVAQVSHGANSAQVIKAMKEAESYHGPSIVICYAPCIEHGIQGGLKNSQKQAKLATTCGYWPIFRYDPRKVAEGKNPFQFDGPRKPEWDTYKDHLLTETRYRQLTQINPEFADKLLELNKEDAMHRYQRYMRMKNEDFSQEALEELSK